MKRAIIGGLVLLLCTLSMAFADVKFWVEPAQVKLGKKVEVRLKGSGFSPGQELAILFVADDGVITDISFALDKTPIADDKGNWEVVWDCSRFISKKIIRAGSYTLKVTDPDYSVLAETVVTFTEAQ
ncbi:hypothetical protein [Thermodesulforhabdus norvegica]|uniref:Uncharacterized protein n=1 Tax=Thermodesulforhabdus norvegica TaxID=39841 RepID=A0A1I4QGI2_9BACT|nr:hypothetical protein [Thermodesulforhabdus norvegica]SFM38760.1 hypothetical protein SAMN05660836_00007 [Thermodesulforhabdus norvegica]